MQRPSFTMGITALLCSIAGSQYPPRPVGLIKIDSTVVEGSQIEYKQADICKLTGSEKSYSGYVRLSPGSLRHVGLDQPLPINTFFWYFESQTAPETAPLTLYLNGGPGSSSITPLLRENGPCTVDVDGTTTRENPWSWNKRSNVLYIDQPVNTGFSYDVAANGTVAFNGQQEIREYDTTSSPPENPLLQAATLGLGSVNVDGATNCTEAAVRALWLSLSVWLRDFSPYNDIQSGKLDTYDLVIWSVSYGGHYVAAFYDFATSQNRLLSMDNFTVPGAPEIRFSTIGLGNACVDSLVQLPSYPEMAFNNTYGLRLVNETTYLAAKKAWEAPRGCRARIRACRVASDHSTADLGRDATVTTLCRDANIFCGRHMANLVPQDRSYFDIGQRAGFLATPTLHTHLAFLNRAEVQAELGVPVNFTDNSPCVYTAFSKTGDNVRGDYAASLSRALDDGVKISLVYGDRDFACNWLGGEALSLAFRYEGARAFRNAGYESVYFPENERSDGISPRAIVRQYNNLSFTRVFDAGHTVGTDWPSIAYTIFDRTVSGLDVASGKVRLQDTGNYMTIGPQSVRQERNQLPVDANPKEWFCYTLKPSFCSARQLEAYLTGQGRVVDHWLVEYGDGSCSPNPVEPCTATGGGQSPEVGHKGIIENVSSYVIYMMLVVTGLVVLVWTCTRNNLRMGEMVAVKDGYTPLRSGSG